MIPWYYNSGYWLKHLFPKREWLISDSERKVFLTFDDGPHPDHTPFVLDLLREYNQRASFFCIGDNVRKFPDIYKRITQEGHRVGNHTFHHLKGNQTSVHDYNADVKKCAEWVESDLFRPPYGRLTSAQFKMLHRDYRIIMWSLLSLDYLPNLDTGAMLKALCKHTRPGSIVVFHDSEKASKNLRAMLPGYLEFLAEKDFSSEVL